MRKLASAKVLRAPIVSICAMAQLLLGQTACSQEGIATEQVGQEHSGPSQDVTERKPMVLGAASNFSQGLRPAVSRAAFDLPVRHFRDGIRWSLVEKERGQYSFDLSRANYPAVLAQQGADLVLTVNFGNNLYDEGATPHSPEALAALGRFTTEMVTQFPAISAIEVGNEFNSANFVRGKVRDDGLARRGAYHIAMLRAVAEVVRPIRPDIKIWGGATHSIPAGYLWPILDNGANAWMDGIAIHPYTTPIDQLSAQIGVLRRHKLAAQLPIIVTEFASQSPQLADDDLVRAYASMAALGIEALYWYPLNERGDNTIPLVTNDGAITQAGEAFRFVQEHLAQEIARDISPDAFTKIVRFGDRALVIWGEPREFTLTRPDNISLYNARGKEVAPRDFTLSSNEPLILLADDLMPLAQNISFGCSNLIADSFYQFSYPQNIQDTAQPSSSSFPQFTSHVLIGGERFDWQTQPGQERGGVPWNPYLSIAGQQQMRLTAENFRLGARRGRDAEIHFNYRPEAEGNFRLDLQLQSSGNAATLIAATVRISGETILQISDQYHVQLDQLLDVAAGQEIEIIIASTGEASSLNSSYRLRLHDDDACRISGP